MSVSAGDHVSHYVSNMAGMGVIGGGSLDQRRRNRGQRGATPEQGDRAGRLAVSCDALPQACDTADMRRAHAGAHAR